MRRAVAIYGASDEALALVPILEANPEIEVAGVFASDVAAAKRRAEALGVRTAIGDASLFERPLHAVVDAGVEPQFAARHPEIAARGVQVVSPLTARLLWGYGASGGDRKAELLQALHEVLDSVNLAIDTDELFARMLEIAMGVTGADGGSLMLLDAERAELRVRVAIGVEPELWPKIRVKLGEGVAGRAAAEARPLKVRGRAGRDQFRVLRDRPDVESALCVPLVHEGRVLGVLNLHHATRSDAFDDDDLAFAEQLGRLDAAIIARAQEHESLHRQASRYTAVRAVREALGGHAPLEQRLDALCARVAELVGAGIATVYLHDEPERELRLAATSLGGAGLGGEYRVRLGQGVDGRAAQTREPVLLGSAGEPLSVAALPLLAGDQLLGVLSVQRGPEPVRTPPRALQEALLEIAAAAAEEIAHAERERRMSVRATQVSAVNEAGIKLLSAREVADVARLATASGAMILQADHAVLRLQDPESRRFVIRSYYGSADGRSQDQLFRLDKQVSVEAIRAQRPRLVRSLAADAATAALAGSFRSSLSAPLRREGRVVGTLALYDKVAPDRFYASAFGDDDLSVFSKYVSYVERALEAARLYAASRELRNFDEDTGLPNAEYIARRIDQELARAAGRSGALAVASCRLDQLGDVRRGGDARRADRAVQRAAEALRAHLREFDVVARSGDAEFLVLLPDPGAAPDERVTALARAVADEIAREATPEGGARVGLAFGYAVYDRDGATREALLARARVTRIQLL